MRIRSIVACAALAPLLLGAGQPLRLQPSSAWDLDYAENSCRLLRVFGQGDSRTVLSFESDAPGNMDMLVVGKDLESYSSEIGARFLPVGGKPFDGRSAKSASTGYPAILFSNVPLLSDSTIERLKAEAEQRKSRPRGRPAPINLAEEAAEKAERQQFASQTTEIEIQTRRNRPVILETGSLGEPIKAFDKCSRDSLRDWGVDPNLEDKIVRRAWAPDPGSWFGPEDYPSDMVRVGEESEVKVRLLVDATGRVTKCTSLSHFKAPEFEQIVCAVIMKRARLQPAELADGTKVPSYYINRVVFQMAN